MQDVQNRPKASDLARGHWRGILTAAGIDEKFLKKKPGPCPICGGKDRFFFDDKGENGTFHCRHCGAGGGFKLLALHLNRDAASKDDFRFLCKFVEDYFGGSTADRIIKPYVAPQDDVLSPEEITSIKASHIALWESSLPWQPNDPVWKYLHNRVPGLRDDMIPKIIRCHPALPYYQGEDEPEPGKLVGKWPAMIVKVMGPDGTVCNLHRTWITEDGKKAPVHNPKKLCKSLRVKGFAIPLAKLNGSTRMATAEGIETALAVLVFKGIPCWSLVSTAGMRGFLAPEGIRELDSFEDNDKPDVKGRRPGFEAGTVLKERNEAHGILVRRHAPQKVGTDMLDMLVSRHRKIAA